MARKPSKSNTGRRGRPKGSTKLQDDVLTCKQISELAGIQCTKAEAASVMGVCEKTFIVFLQAHKKAREAWELGQEAGRASLRRLQWRAAERSTTMQIWLGKQYLGQTDKMEENVKAEHEHRHTVVQDAAVQFDAGLDQHIARFSEASSADQVEVGGRTTH